MIDWKEEYLEDEVRDGFYVSSMMKRAWAAQMEILSVIDQICQKHQLQYFAEWGTLLGAVRHKGYIPWDDDMDICLKRKDYNRLAEVLDDELPPEYRVLDFRHGNEENCNDDFLIRVCNSGSIRFDLPFLEKYHGFPFAAGIDIFALDEMAPDALSDECQCEQLMALANLARCIDEVDDKEKEEYIRQVESLCNVQIDRKKSLKQQFYMLADQVCAMYDGTESEYLTLMPLRTKSDYKIPKKYYDDVIMMPFENIQIPVPVGYNEILKIKYGDYMKICRSGGGHDFPFFKRQEEILLQENSRAYNILYPKYIPRREDMFRGENGEDTSIRGITANILSLLHDIHREIIRELAQGRNEQVLSLLADAQDGAAALGETIESLKGSNCPIVGKLEQYCEALYFFHETFVEENGVDREEGYQHLERLLMSVEECCNQELLQRREVVFLPYSAKTWKALESVWQAAKEDTSCDVYVIPIPYYIKNIDGTLGKMCFDLESYPKEVTLTDFESFDFGLHHPDMIFIQNPYDRYNASMSVPEFFYSSNLKKYTEQLIYIPPFLLDEIPRHDERARKTLEYFCLMPGVVNADRVIVQSEQMRNTYIEALTKFVGEDSRPVWEQRILGIGSPLTDYQNAVEAEIALPAEWENMMKDENGRKKKVVFYYFGPGRLKEQGQKLLDKIERTLDLFKEHKQDILLVLSPDPEICNGVRDNEKSLCDKYEEIIKDYREEKWGIYMEKAVLPVILKGTDAFYGDAGVIANACHNRGIPVMLQNPEI